MNQTKRWIGAGSWASFTGGAVAFILLGGCSLLFESASAGEDGGLRDDSGLGIDAGNTGDSDSGVGEDGGGQVVDAAVTPDAELDDAGNPLVTVTFTVQCPTNIDVPGLVCKCDLNANTDTSSSGDAECALNAVSIDTGFMFTATTTKTAGEATSVCQGFGWSVGGGIIPSCTLATCAIPVSSTTAVTAKCNDEDFLVPSPME